MFFYINIEILITLGNTSAANKGVSRMGIGVVCLSMPKFVFKKESSLG